MRAVRVLLAIGIVAAAATVFVRGPWARHQCNVAKNVVEQFIDTAYTIPEDYERVRRARVLAERMQRCAVRTPGDWQVHYLLGTLHSLAGRKYNAIHSYAKALRLEERPEIYYTMSVLQLETGQPDAALASAEKAAMFSLTFAEEYDKYFRDTLFVRVFAKQNELRTRKAK